MGHFKAGPGLGLCLSGRAGCVLSSVKLSASHSGPLTAAGRGGSASAEGRAPVGRMGPGRAARPQAGRDGLPGVTRGSPIRHPISRPARATRPGGVPPGGFSSGSRAPDSMGPETKTPRTVSGATHARRPGIPGPDPVAERAGGPQGAGGRERSPGRADRGARRARQRQNAAQHPRGGHKQDAQDFSTAQERGLLPTPDQSSATGARLGRPVPPLRHGDPQRPGGVHAGRCKNLRGRAPEWASAHLKYTGGQDGRRTLG